MSMALRTLAGAGAVLALLAIAGCGSAPSKAVPADNGDEAKAEYRVGPGDELSIYVWNRPELSVDVPVRPDGFISTPLVEDMKAAGKTPTELARDIEKELAEYVRSPTVNVIVREFVGTFSDQIRVVGAATNPQALPYRQGMTLLDVMISVGGLREFAAGNRAKIVRRAGGQQTEIPVRLDDLMNDGDMEQNVPMVPGDVLIIPESRF